MRKCLSAITGITGIIAVFYFIPILHKCNSCLLAAPVSTSRETEPIKKDRQPLSIDNAFRLLKIRKDKDALLLFEGILARQPNNLKALWGKAEVLRRNREYNQAEDLLNTILDKDPKHNPAYLSLAYIRYKDDRLDEAFKLIKQVLENDSADKENLALAYMMLGAINSRRSARGWFFSKIKYGTQIKCYFLKAKELAPDLPEVHLSLGTFYLLAPFFAGGDLDRAVTELEAAVGIAPDFATANARLAQCYKKKGDLDKYNFYIRRTKELDPQNEVLREMNQRQRRHEEF